MSGWLFLGLGAAVFVFLFVNLSVAARTAPPDVLWELEDQLGLPGRAILEPLVRRLLLPVIGVIAIFAGAARHRLLADGARVPQRAPPFGQVDPLFGRDLGFYFFVLPVLAAAPRLGHRPGGGHPRAGRGGVRAPAEPRAHRARSPPGRGGAHRTCSASARCCSLIRGSRLLAGPLRPALLAARARVRRLLHRRARLAPGAAVAGGARACCARPRACSRCSGRAGASWWPGSWCWWCCGSLGLGVAPALLQTLPGQAQRAGLRAAVHRAQHPDDAAGLRARPGRGEGLRGRGEPEPGRARAQQPAPSRTSGSGTTGRSSTTYGKLQEIRTYYKFLDVDVDRYMVNGEYRQVMLSARELSYRDLPSRGWINEHLTFTHGYGLVAGPVNRISPEGLPEFFVKDIPPGGRGAAQDHAARDLLRRDRQRVRVRAHPLPGARLSRPGTRTSTRKYEGRGGIPVDSIVRKAGLRGALRGAHDPALRRPRAREPHHDLPRHRDPGAGGGALPAASTATPTW